MDKPEIGNQEQSEIVPEQYKGIETNIFHTVSCENLDEAGKLFDEASSRMKNVNYWHQLSGMKPETRFTLLNNTGEKVNRFVKKGDYFQINIPFPGLAAGKGYDWVRVEEIKEETAQTSEEELFSMLVKPSHAPFEKETAHFFDSGASSTFSVKRKGLLVTASVLGRNESPNTFVKSLFGKLRNIIVAIGSFLGFSHLQWKSLVKGILA